MPDHEKPDQELTPEKKPRRIEPPVTETSQPFWDATREKRFLLQWCVDCNLPIWFPREVCPGCMSSALEWRPASGLGVVYTMTVEHKPQNPAIGGGAPYVVALIDLEEGARMMSNVFGCPPDDVYVGMPVRVAWDELSDGRNLPVFEPRPQDLVGTDPS
jgi:uncharacterized OB-fold protein